MDSISQKFNEIVAYMKTNCTFCIMWFLVHFTKLIDEYKNKFVDGIIKRQLVFFDFETTGLNPYHEKIIEYAFLKGEGNKEEYIDSLVNPIKKFDKKVTDITGIHPDMLEKKEVIDTHIDNISDFIFHKETNTATNFNKLNEIYLVAHNCYGFDKIFFERMMHNKMRNNVLYIDTLVLAKKLLPNRTSYSLSALAKTYNVPEGNHRALSDTTSLRDIYNILLMELAKKKKLTPEYFKMHPEHVYMYCQSSLC